MSTKTRNPGPRWGFAFMRFVDRVSPSWLTRRLVFLGAGVGLLLMPSQRRFSKSFLTEALGREATWKDSWRHFHAFAAFLMERFRAANGRAPSFRRGDESQDGAEILATGNRQALYGTFHFGQSDMMGFWLSKFDISIRMVRYQVGNSEDLEWLDRRFGKRVGFIWVNEPSNMIFALKEAIGEGHSIAMKCDRVAHSSKREVFEFLGRRRWFPFTVYHLAILFDLPVVFAFGILESDSNIEVYSSKIYKPEFGDKRANLLSARAHFSETLLLLENLVRKHPYQWFNFLDALPVADS